jgi:hypothetical protein
MSERMKTFLPAFQSSSPQKGASGRHRSLHCYEHTEFGWGAAVPGKAADLKEERSIFDLW